MKILGIETSTFSGSVSISDDDTLLCEYVFNTGPRHNEVLVPTIERLLSDCGLGKEDLDAVCVSTGPGSFTSLRIGVSTAKALCYSLGTDLAGVPSLEILASNALWSGNDVCVMTDAGRGEIFFSFYASEGEEITKAKIATPESVCAGIREKTVFVGSGAVLHEKLIRETLGEERCVLVRESEHPEGIRLRASGEKKNSFGTKGRSLHLNPLLPSPLRGGALSGVAQTGAEIFFPAGLEVVRPR